MPSPIHIAVPQPCHENWQTMTPQEQGRFCSSCQKMVVDFSMMTDQEVLQYFSQAAAGVCGRFSGSQLNKTYHEPDVKKVKGWRYAWNMIIATFLFTGNAAMAQGEVRVGKPAVEQPVKKAGKKRRKPNLKLTSPLQWITNVSIQFPADTLPVKEGTLPDRKTTKRVKKKRTARNLRCKPDNELVEFKGTWEVMGFTQTMTETTGFEKFVRQWDDWFAYDIGVYPNPVTPGSSVTLAIRFKEKGSYRLEIVDAGGKLMHAQQVQDIEKINTLNISTKATWGKGTYWVRFTSPWARKVYHAKLLLK